MLKGWVLCVLVWIDLGSYGEHSRQFFYHVVHFFGGAVFAKRKTHARTVRVVVEAA